MLEQQIWPYEQRIILVCGHYGSGKTEFSVSLALALSQAQQRRFPRLALVDLDIANPYFRSRERRHRLEQAGVAVSGSIYKREITAELPALSAAIRAPLEDVGCRVIVDAGGDAAGALVLNQFGKYFHSGETLPLLVLNANRPATADVAGALLYQAEIEAAAHLRFAGVVNNTHLLRETTAETVRQGHALALAMAAAGGPPLLCDTFPAGLVRREELADLEPHLLALGMHMRESWQDR